MKTPNIESDDGFVHITDAHPDDARRIVACVNACAGVPTFMLEMDVNGQIQHMRDTLRQRDELLAAAEKAVTVLRELAGDAGCNDDDANELAAAIAKVKP